MPRYEELFNLIQAELQRSGFESLIAAGIVLTGGSAKIKGAVELAEEIFHMPVRLGAPQGITGLPEVIGNPVYSTAVGLLLFGNKHQALKQSLTGKEDEQFLLGRMKAWFKGNF